MHGQDAECLCGRLLASNVELAQENAQLVQSNCALHAAWEAVASQNRQLLLQAQHMTAHFERTSMQWAAMRENADAACDGSGWSLDSV
jgi:hypothetical protein